VAERRELTGEGADDVVGLEALVEEDGDAEGFERSADVGLLLDEVGRGFGAVGLVSAVLDGFEGLGFDVELLDVLELGGLGVAVNGGSDVVDGGEVLGGEVFAELVDHVDEDISGSCGDAGARGHGALALHGVVGAEDEGHGVEEVDRGLGAGGGLWGWQLGCRSGRLLWGHGSLMVRGTVGGGLKGRHPWLKGRMLERDLGVGILRYAQDDSKTEALRAGSHTECQRISMQSP